MRRLGVAGWRAATKLAAAGWKPGQIPANFALAGFSPWLLAGICPCLAVQSPDFGGRGPAAPGLHCRPCASGALLPGRTVVAGPAAKPLGVHVAEVLGRGEAHRAGMGKATGGKLPAAGVEGGLLGAATA